MAPGPSDTDILPCLSFPNVPDSSAFLFYFNVNLVCQSDRTIGRRVTVETKLWAVHDMSMESF